MLPRLFKSIAYTVHTFVVGETDRIGRISKCGDGMLKCYLHEAGNVLLTRVTKWSALKLCLVIRTKLLMGRLDRRALLADRKTVL